MKIKKYKLSSIFHYYYYYYYCYYYYYNYYYYRYYSILLLLLLLLLFSAKQKFSTYSSSSSSSLGRNLPLLFPTLLLSLLLVSKLIFTISRATFTIPGNLLVPSINDLHNESCVGRSKIREMYNNK